MTDLYRSGIPSETQYDSNLDSEEFKRLEQFSNDFILKYDVYLKKYARKWVKDPLHQWSRQWEYPFVLNKLRPTLSGSGKRRILDAGSGITFFPYYLGHEYPALDVQCCDRDGTLADTFEQINRDSNVKVGFTSSALASTPYDDDWFDCIYCISVLEHTADYATIVAELFRLLKPNGKLIVTFDLSLDGKYAISPEDGKLLLHSLSQYFADDEQWADKLSAEMKIPGIFTTLSAERQDATLLPWPRSAFPLLLARSLLTGKGGIRWPPALTVFCLSASKGSSAANPK